MVVKEKYFYQFNIFIIEFLYFAEKNFTFEFFFYILLYMSCESVTKNLYLQSSLYYFSNPGTNGVPELKFRSFESLMDSLPGEISLAGNCLGDMFKGFMERDVLFYFKVESKIKKLNAEPGDFFTSGFFCGISLLGEDEYEIENPDLVRTKGNVYEVPRGKYLVNQGAGLEPEIIRTAGYNLWLDSIWNGKKISQNGYFLRLLGEKTGSLFQVIWPLK